MIARSLLLPTALLALLVAGGSAVADAGIDPSPLQDLSDCFLIQASVRPLDEVVDDLVDDPNDEASGASGVALCAVTAVSPRLGYVAEREHAWLVDHTPLPCWQDPRGYLVMTFEAFEDHLIGYAACAYVHADGGFPNVLDGWCIYSSSGNGVCF